MSPFDAFESVAARYAGRKVIVTGGAGAIGSNLVRTLLGAGASVVVLDDFSASSPANLPVDSALTVVEGDIADEATLARAFAQRPDHVFHLAALFANQNSVENPEEDLRVNGLGTLRLLQAAVHAGGPRVVFASSGCSIYGAEGALPLREGTTTTRLSTPYQITKMLGELYGNYFFERFDLPVVQARLFNSYGPFDPPGRFRSVIPNFIARARAGLPLIITGTGEETRDFTYVEDVVDGLLRLGDHPDAVGQEFNIASGVETRIIDLAERINGLCGNDAGVRLVPRRAWDTKQRLWASIERARTVVGYRPRFDLDAGLRRTVASASLGETPAHPEGVRGGTSA